MPLVSSQKKTMLCSFLFSFISLLLNEVGRAGDRLPRSGFPCCLKARTVQEGGGVEGVCVRRSWRTATVFVVELDWCCSSHRCYNDGGNEDQKEEKESEEDQSASRFELLRASRSSTGSRSAKIGKSRSALWSHRMATADAVVVFTMTTIIITTRPNNSSRVLVATAAATTTVCRRRQRRGTVENWRRAKMLRSYALPKPLP